MSMISVAVLRRISVKRAGLPLAAALLALGAICTTGCSSAPSHSSASAYSRDAAVTARVKAALAQDDALKPLSIGVETHRGTVELSGVVNTVDQITQAVSVARSVDGVEALRSDLHLKPQ